MAEPLALAAPCGATLIERSSLTKSTASYPLSAPRVMRPGRSARGSIIWSPAMRSAWPSALVRQASTTRPWRFSMSAWPMKHSLASRPGPLAIEPGVQIGGALMAVVGAALAVEVALTVAPRRWRTARAILRAEALHRRPGLDQRAVDAEVLRRQQALDPRVGEHGGEKLVRHIAR